MVVYVSHPLVGEFGQGVLELVVDVGWFAVFVAEDFLVDAKVVVSEGDGVVVALDDDESHFRVSHRISV